MPSVLKISADVVGWGYFVAWSVSFYPQIWRNFRRRSVVGLSFDYLVYNLLGFTCYSVYQTAMYFNDRVRREYEDEHDEEASVQLNDVVFALHGLAMVLVMIVQCLFYERGNQTVSLVCYLVTTFFLAGIGILGALVITPWVKLLWFIQGTGYVKAGITVIKYTPQVYVNWKYKSTDGWSIWGVLLDITGGVLSFLQNGLLSIDKGDASQFNDVPKLLLAVLSLFYDAIFLFQHYVLYRNAHIDTQPLPDMAEKPKQDEESPLIDGAQVPKEKEAHTDWPMNGHSTIPT